MSDATASMMHVDEFELSDGRKVRITDRALEYFDDHDDCPFCLGRAAAHRGDGVDMNPFTDAPEGTVKWYDTDHGLWQVGHDLGSSEPGGLLWFEQPNRDGGTEQR